MRATIVVAAFALALSSASSTFAQAAGTAGNTVVYGFGGRCPPTSWSHPAVRPSRAWFSASCELGVRGVHWKEWHRTAAIGHGEILFTAGFSTKYPGTVSLSTVRRHHGRPYFARMVLRWTTRNGKHHKLVMKWMRLRGLGWLWA